MSDIRYQIAPDAGIRWHPYADIFPWIEGAAFEDFKEDIRQNGVREPIVFLDGQILDGRNRYMAARELQIEYPRIEYTGSDPLGFVISTNLKRRHLTESQRAMVATRLANLEKGRPAEDKSANLRINFGDEKPEAPAFTQSQAATMLNVSERSIQTAKKVSEHGAPELISAVESGIASVSAAADISTLPKPEQIEIVAKGEKEILEAAKQIRAARAVDRREERLDKIAEISKGNADLSTDIRYSVIYADPPWRYENPPMGGTNRSIENHYPTMTLEDICAMPVADLATDDAMLYLWATAPKLVECMKVIEAWGFEYRTNIVWDKEVIGMGYHARNQHEILLIAKRGDIPPPQAGKQPSSVHREKRAEHSAKPHFYYEMIEQAYPQLSKIELFCRSPREGWSVWGNQSEAEDAA